MMAYQPYFNTFQPNYCAPVPDQLAQLRQGYGAPMQQASQTSPVIWVQGEEGAKAYIVAPGATVLLMDAEAPVFYLKSADQNGMPTPLRIYDYTERRGIQKQPKMEQADYVTRAELDALRADFEAFKATPKPMRSRQIKAEAEE